MHVSFTIPLGARYRKTIVAVVGVAAQLLPELVHGGGWVRYFRLGVSVLTVLGVYQVPNAAPASAPGQQGGQGAPQLPTEAKAAADAPLAPQPTASPGLATPDGTAATGGQLLGRRPT